MKSSEMEVNAIYISKAKKIFGIGPFGIAISLAILGLLWLIDGVFLRAKILHQPRPLKMAGLVLIGSWICWQVWVMITLRSWLIHHRLCKTGPFRLVRHPMYAGGVFLLSPGVALVFNCWILLLWPILIGPMWSVLVRKEEKIMIGFFGEEYESYAAHTGRLFPIICSRQTRF